MSTLDIYRKNRGAGQVGKEGCKERAGKDGKCKLWLLCSKCIEHRQRDCHIAHGRETNDQQVVGGVIFHRLSGFQLR